MKRNGCTVNGKLYPKCHQYIVGNKIVQLKCITQEMCHTKDIQYVSLKIHELLRKKFWGMYSLCRGAVLKEWWNPIPAVLCLHHEQSGFSYTVVHTISGKPLCVRVTFVALAIIVWGLFVIYCMHGHVF